MMETDFTLAFKRLGHTVYEFRHEFNDKDYDTEYLRILIEYAKECPALDFVISINYIPIISRACKFLNIPYISWLCDCPCYSLYSNTLNEPHNHVFFFDRMHAERSKAINPMTNIYYLPGASNIHSKCYSITDEEKAYYNYDVSFVGSLYSEKGTHERISNSLPPYIMGYVNGIINAQLNVYGYNFMEDSMSESFVEEFKKHMNWQLPPDYLDDPRSIIADYYLGYRCTMLDRINTLKAVSGHFDTHIYTTSDTSMLLNINNHGIADTNTMLPKIYSCSKINLEITSKTFKSGMTLRLFDIMSAGGFVISNYQSEIPEYFTPGEDIVLYESIPDLLAKIDYYLAHEEERLQIASNGHKKLLEHHTYDIRAKQIIDLVF